jgi:hypothetical protein
VDYITASTHSPYGQNLITSGVKRVLGKSIRKFRGYANEFKSPNTFGVHLHDVKTEVGHINGMPYKEVLKTPTTFIRIAEHPVIAEDFYHAIANKGSSINVNLKKRQQWGKSLEHEHAAFHVFSENEIPPPPHTQGV